MKRRRWFEVHSWLGVITGLLLFVICWSGTVAVLSHEIDWLLEPALRVDRDGPHASWGALEASVRRAYPGARVRTLNAPEMAGFAAQVWIDTPQQKLVRVFVDPQSAQVLGHSSYFNVQRFFRSLHMSLFDLWGIGYWIVSTLGFFLLASLIAPLLFYKRWWQRFFSFRTGRGSRAFWSETHKLAGLWGWWFVLLMALTGAWWTFEYADIKLGYPENSARPAAGVQGPALALDALVARARAHWPALDIRQIHLPEDPDRRAIAFYGQTDAWVVRNRANRLYLDARSGDVVHRQTAQGLGWPARWIDTVDPLHFGNFAGLGVKLIWFVFGLALSGLCLTGAYLHAQRLNHHPQTRERVRWRGTGLALSVTVIMLAASVPYATDELKTYGPSIDGVAQLPDVPFAVLAFIVGWIVSTLALLALCIWWLWRPVRRASSSAPLMRTVSDLSRS